MRREINLNEQKQIMLMMMDKIDRFCQENNICYSLAYGTLIGAVRHKGFIPWDDDFDIVMPRRDYERFIKTYNSKSTRYKVIDYSNNKKYYYPFAKIIDTYTVLKEEDVTTSLDLGVYIDVFPIDFCGDDKSVSLSKIKNQMKKWNMLNTIKLMDIKKDRPFYKQAIVMLLKILTVGISWNYVLKKINEVAMIYSEMEYSKYSAVIIAMMSDNEIVETKLFESTRKMEFEGHLYNIPDGYDEILQLWYGDYMILPPEEKRISPHHYRVYWKEKRLL